MHKAVNLIVIIVMVLASYGLAQSFDMQAPEKTPASLLAATAKPKEKKTIIPLKGEEKMPAFSFTDIKGNAYDAQDFKGKMIVLNFWATWCPPCVIEFPRLLEIAHSDSDNIIFIALSSDTTNAAIEKFLTKLEKKNAPAWDRPNIFIARDINQRITQSLFQTYQFPETYIIDRAQRLRTKIIGDEWETGDLQNIIAKLK